MQDSVKRAGIRPLVLAVCGLPAAWLSMRRVFLYVRATPSKWVSHLPDPAGNGIQALPLTTTRSIQSRLMPQSGSVLHGPGSGSAEDKLLLVDVPTLTAASFLFSSAAQPRLVYGLRAFCCSVLEAWNASANASPPHCRGRACYIIPLPPRRARSVLLLVPRSCSTARSHAHPPVEAQLLTDLLALFAKPWIPRLVSSTSPDYQVRPRFLPLASTLSLAMSRRLNRAVVDVPANPAF
jgi:hypothetical protein